MSDDPDAKCGPDPVKQRVTDIITDFDNGRITKSDAIRVRDRADRAVKDFGLIGGIGRNNGQPPQI